MTSKVVSIPLKEASERKNIQQNFIARETHRAKSTINGYFNDVPTPVDSMVELAAVINDSELSQQLAFEAFGVLPNFRSDKYEESAFAMDVFQRKESDERKAMKKQAELALTKLNHKLTEADKSVLAAYANEFLDEILIEIKIVSLISRKISISTSQLINKRVPYWINEEYLK
ncbi:hypothetical protein CKN80_09345 [Carnobacterium divergens]|uniref:hypothetical protein n=1 Tax=Carnobacterium divergens TaxID=2748 RepID=UPI001071B316|nr:hypothetical protein [Carnobacterium divergens]TFJ43955.1 hypothetical protein CKN79_07900 [Carnobacterium divergens]TFJ51150.1 hypothetical protein CKN80_09345 [Carnobacterium divergens]